MFVLAAGWTETPRKLFRSLMCVFVQVNEYARQGGGGGAGAGGVGETMSKLSGIWQQPYETANRNQMRCD